MAPSNANGTGQSAKLRRLSREMTARSHGPQSSRHDHAIRWHGPVVSKSFTYSLTNECSQSRSTYSTLGVAHNTSRILQFPPRSLRLHIGMCSRRSLNELVLSANARFHPSCCSTKIAPPVPLCNSPFHIHSRLLRHEHYLAVPSSLS
jgi:hypothetical protein